ncbi:MAG: HlyD family secretion protein [Ignavibacterium sp.]
MEINEEIISVKEKENHTEEMNDLEDDQPIDSIPLYKKKIVLIPFVLLVIAAIAGWYWYVNFNKYVSTDDAFVDGNRVSISSKVLGRIEKLFVDEGDTLKEGQVVARLDSLDLLAQRDRVLADLILANNSISLEKVNLEKALEDYDRAQFQYEQNIIPKEQYDHIKKSYESAQVQLKIAEAKVEATQAQLNVISTQLKNTVIASPMNGVVAKRWILEGDVVQPGQPIFTVYDLKNLWVTSNFEETKLSEIKLGAPVKIDVDAYPNVEVQGKVIQIGSNTASQFSLIPPNNASGNFTKVTQRIPIKISIDKIVTKENKKNDVTLLPGMSVEVKVKLSEDK